MGVAALVLLTVSVLPAGLPERLDLGPEGRLLVREGEVEDEAGVIRRGDPALYGLAVEMQGEQAGALVSATAGLAERMGEAVDPARSLAVAGSDHVVLAGSGPAVLVYALRRLPTMSLEAFHDYWLSVHADFGRRALAGQGYRQLHADPELSAEVAKSAGVAGHDLDGAVVSQSTDWEAVRLRRHRPELRAAGAAALADEDNFIDHRRSFIMRYTTAGC